MNQRTTRRTFLPWRTADAFDLRVDALTVDGSAIDPDRARDESGAHRFDLIAASDGAAALTVDVSIAHDDIVGGMPPAEHTAPPIAVTVVLECGDGQRQWLRQPCPMKRVGDRWCATVAAAYADLGDAATLRAIAARTRDAHSGTSGLASRAHARVAESRPATLIFEARDTVPASGMLTVKWESFQASDHAERRRLSALPWYVELVENPPIVWLNSDVADLHPVLHSKGTWGAQARMRDLINRTIAGPVWTQLFCAAMGSVERDEDDALTAREGWRRHVLQKLAPHLTSNDRATAFERLLEDIERSRTDPETLVSLIERLGLAVSTLTDLRTAIDGGLRDIITTRSHA